MENRKTSLPDARVTPRFAGVCTFARYPLLSEVKGTPDWVIWGAPFDSGVTYRPGARFGPRAVRDASQYVKNYHIEFDVDVPGVLSLADGGDAPVSPFDCEKNAKVMAQFARELGGAQTRLLALGGDHSIALANMRATWERRGRPDKGLALLHFDSHVDTVDQTLGERFSHASPFIRAIEEGLIDPTRMLSVGVKGPLNTKRDLDYARERGVTLVTYDRWKREGPEVIAAFIERLGDDEAYLSFDIDCVDPAYAPGTGTPSMGGFTSAEALELVRSMKGAHVVGADVVEVLPDRDPSQITALLAAHIAFEVLSLDAVRHKGG